MSPSGNQAQRAETRGSDLLITIVIGVVALIAIPGAIVWVAERTLSAPEAPPAAFPEDAFPAQGFTLSEYRREMEGRLHGLGWIDRDKGIAHVPIELGMQLTLAHKLPARAEAPAEAPVESPDGARKQ